MCACSQRVEVAELKKGINVVVDGKAVTAHLTRGITYEVSYMVKMSEDAHGWLNPVTLWLRDPDGKQTKQEASLNLLPKDDWLYVSGGEFNMKDSTRGLQASFSLSSAKDMEVKKGLNVMGVVIEPK